ALGYLSPTYHVVFSNGFFFVNHFYKLCHAGNWKEGGGILLQMTQRALYLSSLYYGTPAWIVVSLLSQASSELMQAYKESSKESHQPEVVASIILALIRLYKASSYLPKDFILNQLQRFKQLPAPSQEGKIHTHLQGFEQSPTSSQLQAPLHELSGDLEAKIDARRFTMVDTKGKVYDFGSYFHGYGKYLVKGANLNFKKIEEINEDKRTELSFRLNHIYHDRLRTIIKALDKLKPDERSEIADCSINRNATYLVGQQPIDLDSAYEVNIPALSGTLMIGKKEYYNAKDHVKISLGGRASLEGFHRFLSIFGLEDALQRSSDEDLERLKVGVLFRTFFPTEAYPMEQHDESHYTLPVVQLKQKIIDAVPEAKDIFSNNSVQKSELFPGYVRYGVPVDKKVYDLGARALTTALISEQEAAEDLELQPTASDSSLNVLADILKNGLLSQEMRNTVGIGVNGLNSEESYEEGGARSIYTQMVKHIDITQHTKIGSFLYTPRTPFRLYISLKALNLGSYQYPLNSFGTKDEEDYAERSNIFEFVQSTCSDEKEHEIMLPDRVLPQHIMGVSVRNEQVKQETITHLKNLNLIKEEKINGVAVDDFIHTDNCITEKHAQYCGPEA
ncbi:MAG: hypothetical protein ACRDFB_02080, partial [Rhabdochlamydiaceae bacterium]